MIDATIPPMAADAPVVLEMSRISKSFEAVTALVDVSIRLRKGEVLALVGDNGAGKSTLVKILSGFHQPDTGAVTVHGLPARFTSPRDARAQGIETVYQDLAMIGDLSVYHNMFLGREYHKRVLGLNLLDNARMRTLAKSTPRRSASASPTSTAPWTCCRAASANASRSPGRSTLRPRFSSSTSRSRRWARAKAATCSG